MFVNYTRDYRGFENGIKIKPTIWDEPKLGSSRYDMMYANLYQKFNIEKRKTRQLLLDV